MTAMALGKKRHMYCFVRKFIILLMGGGAIGFWPVMLVGTASAGQLTMNPPDRMEFSKDKRTGAITVMQEGPDPVTVDIVVSEWTQDENGRDDYRETHDIIIYPKIMTLKQGDQHVIRAGYNGVSPVMERIYRLLITERSESTKKEETKGDIVELSRVLIYVKPDTEITGGSLEKINLSKEKLTTVVRNTGNVHMIVTSLSIRGITLDGQEVFTKELAGSYVLSGISRAYDVLVPPHACGKLATVEIAVKTNTGILRGEQDVHRDACLR
jgi:fimbrial chaperone protein